jgi:hypothetical protein
MDAQTPRIPTLPVAIAAPIPAPIAAPKRARDPYVAAPTLEKPTIAPTTTAQPTRTPPASIRCSNLLNSAFTALRNLGSLSLAL